LLFDIVSENIIILDVQFPALWTIYDYRLKSTTVLVITNLMGRRKSVCCNRGIVINVNVFFKLLFGTRKVVKLVRYSLEFVVTVIVITEFDCTYVLFL